MGHHSPVTHLRSYPAVAVAAMLQHDLLDQVAQGHVGLTRLVFFPVAVETSPAHLRDLAGVAGLKALKLHHASDLGVDAVAPSSVLFRRDSFKRLKALRKKSRSSVCWPILRSNSAIRRWAASGAVLGPGATALPGGRPTGRSNPAGPSLRYVSRQRDNTARLTTSSWLSGLPLSPYRIRWAKLFLNSELKTRFLALNLDSF